MDNVEQMLLVLQNSVNSVECNFCKGRHKVAFSIDRHSTPATVGYKFSEDTCEAFKRSVLDIAGKQLADELQQEVVCIV